jgi:hypothetical protein
MQKVEGSNPFSRFSRIWLCRPLKSALQGALSPQSEGAFCRALCAFGTQTPGPAHVEEGLSQGAGEHPPQRLDCCSVLGATPTSAMSDGTVGAAVPGHAAVQRPRGLGRLKPRLVEDLEVASQSIALD